MGNRELPDSIPAPKPPPAAGPVINTNQARKAAAKTTDSPGPSESPVAAPAAKAARTSAKVAGGDQAGSQRPVLVRVDPEDIAQGIKRFAVGWTVLLLVLGLISGACGGGFWVLIVAAGMNRIGPIELVIFGALALGFWAGLCNVAISCWQAWS